MPHPSVETPDDARWWDILNPLSSIRAQVALVLGTLALSLTLYFSNRAGASLSARIEADAGPLFETLAGTIRDRIDRGMYERFHELQIAAVMPTFRETATPVGVRRAALNQINDTEEQYAWIGFADTGGKLVAGTQGLREGMDVTETPWYRAVSTGGNYLGDVHEAQDLAGLIARSDGGPVRVFDIATPVHDINGKLIGSLCASLRWSSIEQIQQQVVLESARRRQLIGVTIYSVRGDALLDTGRDIWGAPPPYPPVQGAARFRGYLREEADGASYLTGNALTRGSRILRSPGWMITVRQPDRRAFVEVNELRADIRLMGFSATAFIMVGAWGFAGLLTQRLRAIEMAAEYIRDGDPLALMPRPEGRGDLARMCRALGLMVQALRSRPGTTRAAEKAAPTSGSGKA